jgi:uncharacterized protein YjbI with pentapeptide repeats
LITAVLDQKSNLTNYELLRFIGEEVKFSRDSTFKQALLKSLFNEQLQERERKNKNILSTNEKNNTTINNIRTEKSDKVRAAILMSILVAGCHSFRQQDLGDLDLSGAHMRGGFFVKANFKNTRLANVNFRHANIDEAQFKNCEMEGLELRIKPDLIGHGNWVNSVSFSPDGKFLVSGSRESSSS